MIFRKILKDKEVQVGWGIEAESVEEERILSDLTGMFAGGYVIQRTFQSCVDILAYGTHIEEERQCGRITDEKVLVL